MNIELQVLDPQVTTATVTRILGWNCDPGVPPLVSAFEVATDPAQRQALATRMQFRVLDQAPEMFLGQFSPPTTFRSNLHGVITNGVRVFWNVRRD